MLFLESQIRGNIKKKANICTEHFKSRQFGDFIFFRYDEFWHKEIEFNRGTVHYVKNYCFGLGYLSRRTKRIFGLSLFNFLNRLFIFMLILFGVYNGSNNVNEAIFLAMFFYLIIIFISYTGDKKMMDCVNKILEQHFSS